MRIRTKFLILFFALSLGPLTFIGVMAYRNGRRAIEESLGRLFELRATRAVEVLDRESLQLQSTAQSWTGLELMQDVLSDDPEGRISSFLFQQHRRQEMLARAVVTDATGRVVAASSHEWIGRVVPELRDGGASGAGRPCGDDATATADPKSALLTCAFPIRALFDETRVLGSLRVTWDLGPLFHRLQTGRDRHSDPADLIVLRADGLVVSAPADRAGWIFQRNLLQSGSRAASMAGAGNTGFLVEHLADGEYVVGYSHSPAISGWSALVVQDADTAFAPVYRLRNLELSLGAALALLTVLISIVVSRRGSRPLQELAELARTVAAGDLDVRLEPRSRDEIGSLARSFNHMVDDLKAQRAELVGKEYVDSIISHMADGLMVVDADGVLQRANRALLSLTGVAEDQLIGRRAGLLFVEGEATFRTLVLGPALRYAAVHEVELQLARLDGEPVAVSLSAGALPVGAARRDIVCIATDITHRKFTERALVQAREKAEAGARAKAEFLATMSHEIRTPLNGVIGMTDLLSGSTLSDDQRDWVETARRCGDALLALLNDILDVSKMDAGKLQLERIDFDPRACLEVVADILAMRAKEKGLELSLSVDAALPSRVTGDPARLRQVLLNLGSNAVKFTARGHVLIRAQPAEGGRIRISVADTGVGISGDVRARLFQPFSQADSSTTRKYGGTGLGLAISRQLVELMNGEIGVETEEGQGSTFWFTVDLPPAESAPVLQAPAFSLRGLRVLVVDDTSTNRQVMREMLKAWECAFDEASDGWEGLDKLRASVGTSHEFQLVLIDFQMPEMDGGQLAAEIKRDPRLAHIPLILVTSVPQHGDAALMMSMGFEAYLTKPLKQSVLHDAVAAVIGARSGERPRPTLTLVTAHTVEEAARARNRILVVDDNPLNVRTAVGLFRRAGFECDVAHSGAEAVRAAARVSYGLVLMDCEMPGMNGYEAARLIRRQEGDRSHTPIVAMAGPSGASRQQWSEAGMDDWIRQPPRREDVQRVLAIYVTSDVPESQDGP